MPDLQQTIREHGDEGWRILWQNNQTSWNIEQAAPPLRELIEELSVLPPVKSSSAGNEEQRALVPGCGEVRFYDAH